MGFLGLVKAIEEKEGQLSEYEAKLLEWYEDCKALIEKQDEAVKEQAKPKKRWGLF